MRNLRRKLATLAPGDNRFNVATQTMLQPRGLDSLPIQFRVRLVPGATRMLVTLHGAADPARRQRGVFNGFNPDLADCTQVAVSDPSLQVPGDFGIAWFAGHQGFDTPALLRRAFAEMVKAWSIERTIFFGTSGGDLPRWHNRMPCPDRSPWWATRRRASPAITRHWWQPIARPAGRTWPTMPISTE
ncbi:hypothetical protein ACFS32_02860 [Novosphingobium pokkalii]|uniref:hypothetical protein n=1 Tax=Novosphingobium pokkalii TaxID=1770194 RepID=UPI003638BAC5